MRREPGAGASRAPAAAAAPVDPGLVAAVRTRLAHLERVPTVEEVVAAVRAAGPVRGADALVAAAVAVRAELVGAGPLQPLLDEPAVTDVLVNAPDEVWVDRGLGLERVGLHLGDPAAVRALAVRLAAAAGRRLDDASPTVDARLPDGTRLHAVLPPLTPGCAALSLRAHRPRAFTVEELLAGGTLVPATAGLLRALVAARATLLVSGATGTGKTTLLSTALSLVPHDERIVCIEESGELAPTHPHVVRLVARPPNVEGAGEVGLGELVRQALRMRPDRLVLGECRGAEVRDVLTALNTGHEGGCATLHANAAADVPARLEALASLAGMSPAAVAAQAASAVDAVLHLRRRGGLRYLAEVAVVAPESRRGSLSVLPALTWSPAQGVREHDGLPLLRTRLRR